MSAFEEFIEEKNEPFVGRRILAGFIDYFIIYTLFFLFIYAFGEPNVDGEYSVNGPLAFVPILFWGLATIGIEQWIGATLGNLIVGLKPVSINGLDDELSIGQSFIRHILDPIDMFFFGLVGILSIKNSDRNQRVGDMAAKTIVVKSSNPS